MQHEPLYAEPDTASKSALYADLEKMVSKEIERNTLLMGRLLGDGQFGQVFAGEYRVKPSSKALKVAIKMLRPEETSQKLLLEFLREAAIQGQWSHPNIIGLVGYVTVTEPPMIVIERADETLGECVKRKTWPLDTMVVWLSQIVSAMCYLSARAYIHRDLACRNVLMVKGVAKISDFGRSRSVAAVDAVYQTSSGAVPIRWTAPEALETGKYSVASDVWSLGILINEMWNKAERPYDASWSNHEVYTQVKSGYRLPAPPGCPRIIHRLARQCWHTEPGGRPSFAAIARAISMFKDKELCDTRDGTQVQRTTSASDVGSAKSSTPRYAIPTKEVRPKGPELPPRVGDVVEHDYVVQQNTPIPIYSVLGEVLEGHSMDDIGAALYDDLAIDEMPKSGTMDRGTGDGSFVNLVEVKDSLSAEASSIVSPNRMMLFDSDGSSPSPVASPTRPKPVAHRRASNKLEKRTSKWMTDWERRTGGNTERRK